ncbi:MAG: SDR family NAD(P)-dependent oxidoreductase [Verrucomicrobiae bacterium]|nr:SDR family NAD(P)-dependent oxidoreductase [Verrucomicrobiae bacterium]
MKKYLVTGGTGFIGAACVRQLLAEGHGVRVIDNNSRGAARRLTDLAGSVEMVEADIRDSAAMVRAAEGMDAILHLAYVNGTEYFYTKPELILDVAVRGMLAVLDACRAHGIRELVLASSSEVYQTAPKIPTDESVPLTVPDVLNPRFSYGGGKLICELMAVNYGRTGFDRVMIFRPHNVYGPDMGGEHVIPQFSRRLAGLCASQSSGVIDFSIQGTGQETRSFIYIDDFVEGLMTVLRHGSHLGIYHIGTQEEVTVAELARLTASCLGREIRVVPGSLQPGSTPRRCPDISRLRLLGFTPRLTLSEGLNRTVPWYASHP